jgi:hypothetical protein
VDSRFAESLVNRDDHRVLGVRLHPYCFYDAMFLELAESPLLLKHRNVVLADLYAAVGICSAQPEVLLRGETRSFSRLRRWRMRRMNLEAEVAKFIVYVKDYDARPVFWEGEGEGGGSLRAPWILSIATFLENHSNMKEREIMTAPIGKMLWKSAALAEQMGLTKSQLMTEEEEAAIAELNATP